MAFAEPAKRLFQSTKIVLPGQFVAPEAVQETVKWYDLFCFMCCGRCEFLPEVRIK
jgi:hypothetical protein